MNQERSTTNEWVIPTISSTREPHNLNYNIIGWRHSLNIYRNIRW